MAFSYNRRGQNAREVEKEITGTHGRICKAYQASLDQKGAAEKLADQALGDFGTFDVLFCNAGLTMTFALEDEATDTLDHLINLNYRSSVILARQIACNMIENRVPGCILFNTSVRGKQAYPRDGVYGGLKSALERGAQSFALDLAGYNIRVNCVAPGATVSPEREKHLPFYTVLAERIPLQRLGRPEDIGKVCVWLASPEAAYITGQTIIVDGGLGLPGIAEEPSDAERYPWLRPWEPKPDRHAS